MNKIFIYRFGPKTIEKEDLEFLNQLTVQSTDIKSSESQWGMTFNFSTELDLKDVFTLILDIYDENKFTFFSINTVTYEIKNNASFALVNTINLSEVCGVKEPKPIKSKIPKRFSIGPKKRKSLPKLYQLNELLDLISKKGIDRLTKEQLKQLNNFSKNI
jgi:hypothetical protein